MADMKGYDRAEAVRFILGKLDVSEFKRLADRLPALVGAAIDADMAYMARAGVIDGDGMMGDQFYDDDDAFEYILDALAGPKKPAEPEMRALSAFVDQYMELQEQYMASADLIDWE